MTQDYLLSISGVNKSFGGLKALQNVSLNIKRNQIYGLIGPNGAGKTTFFNVITGMYEPDSGEFILDGKPYDPKTPHLVARAGIARTFQNIRLFGQMTALENVMVGRHTKSSSGVLSSILRTKKFRAEEAAIHDRAKELLHYVGLDQYDDYLARNLSYGHQRRLEIARALATEPKLLALDEPAAGMNDTEKSELAGLIERISQDGVTVLLIEHDFKFVARLCNEITVLDFGQELAKGLPEEVRQNEKVREAYLGKSANQ